MKSYICVFLMLICFGLSALGIEENKIIPAFYHLLMRKDAPSEEEERLFFGGGECVAIREAILKKPKYENSKTPIWDFVRDQKFIFITEGIVEEAQFKAIVSNPFESFRSWSQNATHLEKRVHVSFPSRLLDPKKMTVSGFASVTFKLGRDCYINIGATTVCKSATKAILDSVYGPDQRGNSDNDRSPP